MDPSQKKQRDWSQYSEGFKHGVSGQGMIPFWIKYPKEYLKGFNDGTLAYQNAIEETRKRLKIKLTSTV